MSAPSPKPKRPPPNLEKTSSELNADGMKLLRTSSPRHPRRKAPSLSPASNVPFRREMTFAGFPSNQRNTLRSVSEQDVKSAQRDTSDNELSSSGKKRKSFPPSLDGPGDGDGEPNLRRRSADNSVVGDGASNGGASSPYDSVARVPVPTMFLQAPELSEGDLRLKKSDPLLYASVLVQRIANAKPPYSEFDNARLEELKQVIDENRSRPPSAAVVTWLQQDGAVTRHWERTDAEEAERANQALKMIEAAIQANLRYFELVKQGEDDGDEDGEAAAKSDDDGDASASAAPPPPPPSLPKPPGTGMMMAPPMMPPPPGTPPGAPAAPSLMPPPPSAPPGAPAAPSMMPPPPGAPPGAPAAPSMLPPPLLPPPAGLPPPP